MNISEIINEIESDIECQICFEKFIKLTYEEFEKLLDDKGLLTELFEYSSRLFEDRFECLTCKNVICCPCYWSFENHKFKPREDLVEFYACTGDLDQDGFTKGCPGEDCPIICPFCRKKDYKIFYGNKIPYELLNEIKNRRFD